VIKMATCKICKSNIIYNQYKIVKGEVYCPTCADKLAEEKKQAKRKRRQRKKVDNYNPYAGAKQDE